MADAEKRVYTVKELQDILHVGRLAIYDLLKSGAVKYVMIGGKYLINKKSFDEWLDQEPPAPEHVKAKIH